MLKCLSSVCLCSALMTSEPCHTHIPPKSWTRSKHVENRFAVFFNWPQIIVGATYCQLFELVSRKTYTTGGNMPRTSLNNKENLFTFLKNGVEKHAETY